MIINDQESMVHLLQSILIHDQFGMKSMFQMQTKASIIEYVCM